jgi:ribosomal protein L10
MAKTRAKKQEDLNFLDIDLNSQKSLVFIALENDSKNKESLNAKKNFDLRFGLNQQKVGVKMIKLTLAQKAFPNLPKLTGQLYLAYSKQTESVDEVTVPKAVINVLQDDQYKNTLNVLGAIVNTEFYDDKKTCYDSWYY